MRAPTLLPVVLAIAITITACASCPEPCACKWKSGKQTVECVDKSLALIPNGLEPSTQVLEFSGNNLQVLPKGRFETVGLVNLQKIYMSRCMISRIDDAAFRGLSNLVELDLSENLLAAVPSSIFGDFPSLMRLILSDNPIRALRSNAFQQLAFLTTLELSECEIALIEDEAFVGLNHLEWLKLDGNRLTTMRGSRILPDTLHGVDLHNNEWHCDCNSRDLHAWLLGFNVPPFNVEPSCSTPPRLSGHPLRSLRERDLACLPDVSPTAFYLEIGEGKNVSLLCHVAAVPEAKVSWWFQGQLLQNDSTVAPGVHLYYYVEEGTVDKRSELFIYNTNSEDNGTFACVAENPAGKKQSNYTIRVVVKEEPIVVVVAFPFRYLVALALGAGALFVLVLVVAVVIAVKCRGGKGARDDKDPKDASPQRDQQQQQQQIQQQQLHQQHHHLRQHFEACPLPAMCYAPSPYAFQLERNPDLISDAEKAQNDEQQRRVTWQDMLVADVHLDLDGYPLDFGLPKLVHYGYAGVVHQEPYAPAALDVRYTADGYPFPPPDGFGPSTTRCVPTQTGRPEAENSSESPDEGYGGDAADI